MALVSIIIPTIEIDDRARRCIQSCESLPQDKEIIVVTDKECPGFPAAKRNWAMQRAKGEIFAFIDSDARCSPGWLENALYWLQTHVAVCGPGVLPPEAPKGQHIANTVHQWVFCKYRVVAQKPRMVPWYPTFNLLIRREVATAFDNYLTGEDDLICLRIKEGIFYHPSILVYHDRRGIFKPLWKQFGTWGRHKGHFVRLSLLAWVSTLWTYSINWVRGFFGGKL